MPIMRVFQKSLPWLFYAAVVIFLIVYFKNVDVASLANVSISWFYLLIASIVGLVFRYWGAWVWLFMLRGLGAEGLDDRPALFYVHAQSWLGRYIPGTAPWILAKVHFASHHGVSKNKLVVSTLLESALQVIVIMGFSFLMLIFDSRLDAIDQKIKFALVVTLIALAVLLAPPVFNAVISFGCKLLKRRALSAEHMASSYVILRAALLYTIWGVAAGLSFFFMAKAFYEELGFDNLLFVMGASNLAGALGMLAVFVPSGAGVWEGVLVVLFSLIMPAESALLVVVAMRLWSVMLDLLFFCITWSHRFLHRRARTGIQ